MKLKRFMLTTELTTFLLPLCLIALAAFYIATGSLKQDALQKNDLIARATANQHHLHAVSRCVGVVVVAPVGRTTTADLRSYDITIFPKQHLLGITICTADIAFLVITGVRGVAEIRWVIGSP